MDIFFILKDLNEINFAKNKKEIRREANHLSFTA